MTKPLRYFDSTLQLHRWAHKHLICAERLVNEFVASEPYEFFTDFDSQTNQYIHKARLTKSIPPEISLYAFDLLNALRACLDYAIYASSVVLIGTDPENTKFPFGDDLKDARRRGLYIVTKKGRENIRRDTHPEIIERVLKFQPYKGGNSLLVGLNKLRNMKHHRHLATTALALQKMDITGGFFVDMEMESPVWNPIKNELELFRTSNPETRHNVKIVPIVTLGETPAFEGENAIGVFTRIFNKVAEILSSIEAETLSIHKKTPSYVQGLSSLNAPPLNFT